MDFEVRPIGGGQPVPVEVIRGQRHAERLFLSSRAQTRFENARLASVNLSGSKPLGFIAEATEFTDCDFSRVSFGGGSLSLGEQSTYRRCSFRDADLRRVFAGSARFESCDFTFAKLDDWGPESAEFIGCTFAGRLADVRFSGRPIPPESERMTPLRSRNVFEGNDFTNADLRGVRFARGIDLDRQRLPIGRDYLVIEDLQQHIEYTRRAVARWTDDRRREAALRLLQRLSNPDLYGDQRKIFIRPADFGSIKTDSEFWRELSGPVAE
jgi:uncharacterized protein YjbI with pentapeptide repeats